MSTVMSKIPIQIIEKRLLFRCVVLFDSKKEIQIDE